MHPSPRFAPLGRALLLALAAAPACAGVQGPPLAGSEMDAARALHADGRHEEAWDLLEEWEADEFDLGAQRDFQILAGDVCDARGDWNRTIRFYEGAMVRPGPADEALRIERRLLELGIELLEGKRRILIVFKDRSRGVVTLENLAAAAQFRATRAEALALLAEYRFARGEYADAAPFYAGLLDPELAGLGYEDLAAYRLGACSYLRIESGKLNGTLIQQALDQFRAYLAGFPQGLHRAEAETARADLIEQYGAYHVMLADYYARIDNLPGERFHLEIAAGRGPLGHVDLALDVRATEAAATAERRLAELPPEAAPDAPDAP